MIPKIIHYCWFGPNDISEEVESTISNWKLILPDYQFILWDESSFDVNMHVYTKEAYEERKYAYVTDFVRLYALKNFGGIYMDTDVDVIKSLDPLLESCAFTGSESNEICVTGTMGSIKDGEWINSLLSYYDNKSFIVNNKAELIPNTKFITEYTIREFGWKQNQDLQKLKSDLIIYPFDYLCAKEWDTGRIMITDNTYTVHNFNGSWLTPSQKKMKKIKGHVKMHLKKVIGDQRMSKVLNRYRKFDGKEK